MKRTCVYELPMTDTRQSLTQL